MSSDASTPSSLLEEATRQLTQVLQSARELVVRQDNDFSWSGWKGSSQATEEIDGLIAQTNTGQLPSRTSVSVLFAPTGSLQELSLASGWAEQYLQLSERYDAIEQRLWPDSDA
jgi:hypothetical protein